MRDSFLGNFISSIAQDSPDDVMKFIYDKIPAGSAQNAAMVRYATSWAQSDPQAAASWVNGLADPATRVNAIQDVMSQWAGSDPASAAQWLAMLPTGDIQNKAAQSFANQAASQYPELAAAALDKITEPEQRNAAIENIARQWLQSDPTSGKAWLATVSLPEDRKQVLLKPDGQNTAPAPPAENVETISR